jgi:hypothetical protein
MIFIHDDAIPMRRVNPLVLGLDAAGAGIAAEIILKRAKADERLFQVGIFRRKAAGRDELPAFEIHMALQIFLPRVLHGGFEGQHQNTFPAHLFCKLIRGEGFAETHLGVPQKMRRPFGVFLLAALEIRSRFLHRRRLLRAHFEIQRAAFLVRRAGLHGDDGGFDLLGRTFKPLAVHLPDAGLPQVTVNVMIPERRAVIPHRGFFHQNPVRRFAGFDNGILRGDAFLRGLGGVADFQQTIILRVCVLVGVDGGPCIGTRREKFLAHGFNGLVGNPNGIAAISPGLARLAPTLGLIIQNFSTTPTGLHPPRTTDATPLGLYSF